MDVRGKVAVITGASRGIGAGLAQSFAARGMKLALCARSECPVPAGADAFAAQVDVSQAEEVNRFAAQAAERFGAIDIWINNAGVLQPIVPLRELSGEALLDHMRVNVLGVLYGSQAYIAHVSGAGRAEPGVLVNISSGAAWHGYAGWGAYCAGKAAVDRLSEVFQLEEGDLLRVYSVAPGIVDTDMQAEIRASDPDTFPMVQRFIDLKAREVFNSSDFVAGHILGYAFDPEARPEQVTVRVPNEKDE